MEFAAVIGRAMEIRKQYAALERQRCGRPWSRTEIALGFVGDVGDLAKLVLAENGVRAIDGSAAKLAHELADCLWSVCVLAELHGVDLERAFVQTMDDLEQQLATREGPELAP